ncbi:MAG: biopolymer transporter ExbD [Leptolyngbyaceae cyanobacterium HOT.MB2.61]|jgi:biopolymer transport protein ExbD|nr:biopolymer transporter ExbD [Leptolyngbyaceae cyanobacterium HOT.MB2.61]
MVRNRQNDSRVPEVNLVPMMDVLMTVLTFFIIISMTLTGQQAAVRVNLPSAKLGVKEQGTTDTMIVGLDNQGQILVEGQPVNINQLAQKMVTYLDTRPNGIVVLKADQKLSYDKVAEVLQIMQDIGGESVSLAVDKK